MEHISQEILLDSLKGDKKSLELIRKIMVDTSHNSEMITLFDFYKKHAENNSYAQYLLGKCYKKGYGVIQNNQQALICYQLSAKQGNSYGENAIGCHYYDVGKATNGYHEAFHWFGLSANQGNHLGQKNLGDMYRHGYGTIKNKSKAFELYQLSASQGYSSAQHNLALMYEQGDGTTKNPIMALKYIKICIEQGNDSARLSFKRLIRHESVIAEKIIDDYIKSQKENEELKTKINSQEKLIDKLKYDLMGHIIEI